MADKGSSGFPALRPPLPSPLLQRRRGRSSRRLVAVSRRARSCADTIELPCVPGEEPLPFIPSAASRDFAQHFQPSAEAAGQGADRPIAAKHEPVETKSLQSVVDIGLQLLWFPGFPVRLCRCPRDLAPNIRKRGQPANVLVPGLEGTFLDAWIAQVVEHKGN